MICALAFTVVDNASNNTGTSRRVPFIQFPPFCYGACGSNPIPECSRGQIQGPVRMLLRSCVSVLLFLLMIWAQAPAGKVEEIPYRLLRADLPKPGERFKETELAVSVDRGLDRS